MRTDIYSQGPNTPPATLERCVVDDFPPDLPVTEAELDVIEAFLVGQLRAILASSGIAGEDMDSAVNSDLTRCHKNASLSSTPRCKSRE